MSWTDFTFLLKEIESRVANKEDRGKVCDGKRPLFELIQPFSATISSFFPIPLDQAFALCRHRKCAEIRDRWYGCLGMISEARGFPVDFNAEPAELLLNVLQYLQLKNSLHLKTLNEINVLVQALEVTMLSLCVDCSLTEPMPSDISIISLYLDLENPAWQSHFLLLTFDWDDTDSWGRVRDFFRHTAWPWRHSAGGGYCSLCGNLLRNWNRNCELLTTRAALN